MSLTVFLVSLAWSALSASLVYRILCKEELRFFEKGDFAAPNIAPSVGAAVTVFFALAAPLLLGWVRGVRGVFEGLGIVTLQLVGAFGSLVALAALT